MIQEKIKEYIDSHREEILEVYKTLINLEGRGDEVQNLNRIADYLVEKFSEAGVKCELLTYGDENAPKLVTGVLGADRPGKPVCFSGHYDTVFAQGEFGENPFHIEDGKAYGPGVLDMKGGIVIALYAIQALQAAGFTGRPIKICFCGDEDGGFGKQHEPGKEMMHDYVADSLCLLNMETSPIRNALAPGRKGGMACKGTVYGVGAHSGNDYLSGRNAIVEMAYKVIELYNLRDLTMTPGITTSTPAIIKGGTGSNAVPDKCELWFDGRIATRAEMHRLEKQMREIFARQHIEGTHGEIDRMVLIPPLDKKPQNVAFFDFSNKIAEKYGYPTNEDVFMGGGSDASDLARDGLPTMCACGIRGEWNHTHREYADVESLFERSLLWATVISEITEDVFDGFEYGGGKEK